MKFLILALSLALSVGNATHAAAKPVPGASISLPGQFSDHAILQRETVLPIWGESTPGARIEVTLNGKTCETIVNSQGNFTVRLPAQPAGGPYELVVKNLTENDELTVKDVYLGDIWLAGGQSNMAWTMEKIKNINIDDPAESDYPQIRFFNVPLTTQPGKLEKVEGSWVISNPETVGKCSAVGYFFARNIHRELGVPVGILSSNWGGTIAEAWISRRTLAAMPQFKNQIATDPAMNAQEWWQWLDGKYSDQWLTGDHNRIAAQLTEQGRRTQAPILADNRGVRENWHTTTSKDNWQPAKVPGYWQENGEEFNTNGVVWFRYEIELPESMLNEDLTISLGSIDKIDTAYFNGTEIGSTGELFNEKVWDQPRVYTVPAQQLNPGKNILAIRNTSHIYGGGMNGPAELMFALNSGGKIPLDGEWLCRKEQDIGKVSGVEAPGTMYVKGILFQNMIEPLLPLAIRGVIWYQGESNQGNSQIYRELMTTLIKDWRYYFEQPELPFLQVQLAGFEPANEFEQNATWPLLREAQQQAANDTGNLLMTAIDLGEAENIHPQRKLEVGTRLAECALQQVYGKNINSQGPTLESTVFNGESAILTFKNCDGGLQLSSGDGVNALFAAGIDGVFYKACGKVEGNSVTITAPGVSEIIEIRYAWAQNPEAANLCNKRALPAYPFRAVKPTK